MYKSKFESEAFGLNFYRADHHFLAENNTEQQKEILATNQIDVVKFAIDSKKYDVSNEFQAFRKKIFLNTILNYRKDTTVVEDFPVVDDYELVNAAINDSKLLFKLIEDVFENTTFGYANIPFLKNKINEKQELYAMQTYLTDLLKQPDSGIQLYKSKEKNDIIGFSSYAINDKNEIYRAYAGILPSKWNKQHYERLVYSMIHYNYQHQINAITFGARADNLPLINKFSRVGCRVMSIDYTYIAEV